MKKSVRGSGYLLVGLLALVMATVPVAISGAMDHGKMDHGKKKHKMKAKTVTIEGEVVDMACYIGHGAKGKKHSKCAKMCLLGGTPSGILTDDGKLYLIVDSHGKKVSLKGKPHMSDGIKAITAEKVRKLT